MKCVGLFVVSLLLLYGTGCMIIPTPEHGGFGTRGRIEKETLKNIVEGQTTREDVLLQLGEPEYVSQDERFFAYHSRLTAGYFVAGGGYYSDYGPIGQRYLVLMEFDEHGVLKEQEVKKGIFLSLDEVFKWQDARSVTPPPHG